MSCLNYFVHSPQRQIDDRLTEWCDFMRPTSGIEFCLQSQTWGMNLVWMEEAAVLLFFCCSFIFLLVLIQTEATRWRLNNITPPLMGAGLYPAIMGKITHGCSSGSPGNLWSLHLHTNSFIPALHKQKMPRAPLPFMCTFAALTTLVFMPLSLSLSLPGSQTAAHRNALNYLQSHQQMTPRGLSSCCSSCTRSLMPHSRRKHPPNSSIRSPAQTHHLLLGIWVT